MHTTLCPLDAHRPPSFNTRYSRPLFSPDTRACGSPHSLRHHPQPQKPPPPIHRRHTPVHRQPRHR